MAVARRGEGFGCIPVDEVVYYRKGRIVKRAGFS